MSDLQQRRAEEKEQRREAIVDAAERVFAGNGFDAATMDDVAKAARVSRALVYLYFRNKAELHLAICVRALRLLRERFLAAAAAEPDGYARIQALGRSYMAFAGEFPCYFVALSRLEIHAPDQVTPGSIEQAVFEAGRAVHQVTVDCIEDGMRDGSIRPDIDQPLLAAMSLWAFTHGVIQLVHTKRNFFAQIGFETGQFAGFALDFGMRALHPRAGVPDAPR